MGVGRSDSGVVVLGSSTISDWTGETSEDVSNRFCSEANSRGANENSVIVFAVGINDSSRINSAHRVDLAKYVRNMGRINRRAMGPTRV